MPTENEFKFVINLDCEKDIVGLANKHCLISQGYIMACRGVSLRLRKSQTGKVATPNISGSPFPMFLGVETLPSRHVMTFKSSVGGRVIEIEKKINQRDFNDLWPICLNKLVKHRHIVKDWEVDFFKDHRGDTYFAMAELELPEGKQPGPLPEFISNNLVYTVKQNDCRFSSKSLGDVRHAVDLLKSLC